MFYSIWTPQSVRHDRCQESANKAVLGPKNVGWGGRGYTREMGTVCLLALFPLFYSICRFKIGHFPFKRRRYKIGEKNEKDKWFNFHACAGGYMREMGAMWQIGILTGKPCIFWSKIGPFRRFGTTKNEERLSRGLDVKPHIPATGLGASRKWFSTGIYIINRAKMCKASKLERPFTTLCLFHAPTGGGGTPHLAQNPSFCAEKRKKHFRGPSAQVDHCSHKTGPNSLTENVARIGPKSHLFGPKMLRSAVRMPICHIVPVSRVYGGGGSIGA